MRNEFHQRNTKATYANSITNIVGNTPLVKLQHLSTSLNFDCLAKLELLNPSGSIKDRTALHMLENAIHRGEIKANTTIIESTSGNMGIGLAWICLQLGIKLILVVDPHLNSLNRQILESLQVRLITVEEHDGKGGYLLSRLAKVQELLATIENSYTPNQYQNPDNPGAHERTVAEIMQDLASDPDYIFVPTSTGGTICGISQAIKRRNSSCKIIAVDAVGSVIFGKQPAKRLIPGMGSSRKSDFINVQTIDDVVQVSDADTIASCLRVRDMEGLLIGGSSGAVIHAIDQYKKNIKPGSSVVAIFCDRGERYMDTIYNPAWAQAVVQ